VKYAMMLCLGLLFAAPSSRAQQKQLYRFWSSFYEAALAQDVARLQQLCATAQDADMLIRGVLSQRYEGAGAYSHRALWILMQHYLSVFHEPTPAEQGRLRRYCASCARKDNKHEHLVAEWQKCFVLLSRHGKQWTLTHWENLNEWLFYDPDVLKQLQIELNIQYFEEGTRLTEERFYLQQDTLYYVKALSIQHKTHTQTFSKLLSVHDKARIYKTLYTQKALEDVKIKEQLTARRAYTIAKAVIHTHRQYTYDIQSALPPEKIKQIRILKDMLLQAMQP
jgi:hypothetical protein